MYGICNKYLIRNPTILSSHVSIRLIFKLIPEISTESDGKNPNIISAFMWSGPHHMHVNRYIEPMKGRRSCSRTDWSGWPSPARITYQESGEGDEQAVLNDAGDVHGERARTSCRRTGRQSGWARRRGASFRRRRRGFGWNVPTAGSLGSSMKNHSTTRKARQHGAAY